MKVAAYLRVSTNEQAEEGYSIAAQKNKLQAYAISQGWEIVRFYVDEGKSAKDTERPELQKMLRGVREKAFECILVYRLDRLTRSVLDLHELIKTFEKYDVKFKSATEVFDTTTAMGRLFITIVGALAEWERENLAERVRFGMEQKAKEGKWTTSTPPFGYDRDGDGLKVNPEEAPIVREMYRMYIEGKMGMTKIAAYLNQKGLTTKKGHPFNTQQVRYMLSNPAYVGTLRYNVHRNKENYFEIKESIPPIIDEYTFQQVQELIKRRSSNHPRRATSPYIFSGLLHCARCGWRLVGTFSQYNTKHGKEKSYYYYCKQRESGTCDMSYFSEARLEKRFIEWLEDQVTPELTAQAVEETEKNDDSEGRRQEIEKALKAVSKRREKWQYAWVNDMFSKDEEKNNEEFQKRMKEEDEKEKALLREREALQVKEPVVNYNIKEMLIEVKENWKYMNKEEKKQFVQMIVKSITVDKDPSKPIADAIMFKDITLY